MAGTLDVGRSFCQDTYHLEVGGVGASYEHGGMQAGKGQIRDDTIWHVHAPSCNVHHDMEADSACAWTRIR